MMNRSVPFTAAVLIAVVALVGCSSEPGPADSPDAKPGLNSLFSQDLHDALPQSVRDAGTLKLIGDVNAPWRVVEADGETLSGFQADLMATFEDILGVEITNEMTTGIPAVKLGVQSERFDVAFGPLLDTAETEKELTFLVYTSTRPTFTFTAGSDPITSIADLCGTTIAYVDGSVPVEKAIEVVNDNCAAEGLAEAAQVPLADASATMVAVQSGRADSAAMGIASAAYAKTQQPDLFDFYMGSAEEFATDYNGMAIAPENTELIEALLGAWQIAFDEGIYSELMKKYGMSDAMVNAPEINLATS